MNRWKPEWSSSLLGLFEGRPGPRLFGICNLVSARSLSLRTAFTNTPKPKTLSVPSAMPRTKLILSVNAGSSSIKLSLYSASFGSTPLSLVKSSVSGLTSPPAKFSYSNSANEGHNVEDRESANVTDQTTALSLFLKHLEQDESLKKHGTGEIELVVHRVVHGGLFPEAVVLNEEAIQEIAHLTDLAPLYLARFVESL